MTFFKTFVNNVLRQENSKNVFSNDKAFASEFIVVTKGGSIDQSKLNSPLSSIKREKRTMSEKKKRNQYKKMTQPQGKDKLEIL